ncbi:MAG TPA: hypothetical protein VGP93_13955, partial [Polyangiaceae bacterium]|nr:hypothetical protein [Polyangiaceae bacterium]
MTEAWFGSWFGFRQAAALLLATVPLGLCHCAAPTPKPHASGAEVGGASAGAPAFDAAGSAGASTGGAPSAGSSSMSTGGSSPGTVTTGVETALPELPTFTQVGAVVRGDSVEIAFTPVDSAVDYRVYPLPRDEDVAVDASGLVTIKNAIYRCAGNRQAPGVRTDIRGEDSGNGIVTLVEPNGGTTVSGYVRTLDEATLGYVRVTPAPGFIPVYALGASPAGSDNGCDSKRWNESRDKRYTVSEQERGELLSQRYRDDGVAFYVPDTPGAETHSVYTSKDLDENRLYYVDGPEAALRGTDEAAFQVLNQLPSDAGPELQPLMRVYYYNVCGNDHDELAPG